MGHSSNWALSWISWPTINKLPPLTMAFLPLPGPGPKPNLVVLRAHRTSGKSSNLKYLRFHQNQQLLMKYQVVVPGDTFQIIGNHLLTHLFCLHRRRRHERVWENTCDCASYKSGMAKVHFFLIGVPGCPPWFTSTSWRTRGNPGCNPFIVNLRLLKQWTSA